MHNTIKITPIYKIKKLIVKRSKTIYLKNNINKCMKSMNWESPPAIKKPTQPLSPCQIPRTNNGSVLWEVPIGQDTWPVPLAL